MKFCEFLIIFGLLGTSQCDSVTFNCGYEDSIILDFVILLKDINSRYYCNLKSESDSAEEVTKIEGQHQYGKSDDDVKALYILDSKLTTFSSVFCQKFKNLEYIRMNVKIGSIDEDSLQNCQNLDKIYFDGNKLRELPEKLLAENSKLTQIWIRFNDLTSLPENFFQNQHQLEQLVLEGNQLSFLAAKIFQPLVKLQNLSLRYNKLQVIDPEWFVNLKSLKILYFSGNQILDVPEGTFKSLESLEGLWLNANKIKTLSPDSFEGLQNLKVLALQENEISELPRGVFVSLKNLELLSLNSNKLTVIHSDSFGTHNQLVEIRVQVNKITAIDEKFIDKTAAKYLNIESNLCCNEDIWERSEMKENLRNCFDNYKPRTQTVQYSTCGKSMTVEGRIIEGAQVSHGAFPWIAAMVKDKAYFCGGTLVTNQKVVTAAHCIQDKGITQPLLAREVVVLLGVHDLDNPYEAGRFQNGVQKIFMHDDWNPNIERFDADIAVLVMEQEVPFGRYIQPICLIDSNSDIKDIRTGKVVGYGRSEDMSKLHENIARVIDMPIQDSAHCFLSNYNLARVSSNRTFCAGTGTGTGVCNGDSGNALAVLHDGVYYFRGIVSTSIIDYNSQYGCDVDNYSVFTDMLKFNDWVNGISTSYRR